MKAINAVVPRGLQVLLIMAVLAVLVILFAPQDFLYPGIGIAVFLALVAVFFIYRRSAAVSTDAENLKTRKKKRNKGFKQDQDVKGDTETESENSEKTSETTQGSANSPSLDAAVPGVNPYRKRFTTPSEKPSAFDVADKYYRMAAITQAEEEERNTWKPEPMIVEPKNEEPPARDLNSVVTNTEKTVHPEMPPTVVPGKEAKTDEEISAAPVNEEPRLTLINDETSLTEEEKSELENAVWYRCENPFCKYTHFLDVHHIIDEKNGGTNRLDNLIVLCPYCHDLAHKNEIPEKEMRLWISNREKRFKFKVNWRYD